MREFFKPLRRKVGVLTLGLACVSSIAWLRSSMQIDVISYNGKTHSDIVSICRRGIMWELRFERPLEHGLRPGWNYMHSSDQWWVEQRFTEYTAYGVGGFRLSYNWHAATSTGGATLLTPHWAVTIPLTLLSAYLLLSKPRQAKSPEPPTPEPDHA